MRNLVVAAYAAAMMLLVGGAWIQSSPALREAIIDFQGLIGAAATIVAGGFVLYQTRQAANHEKERRRLTATAARALLPHHLDDLMAYSKGCMLTLRDIRPQTVGGLIAARPTFRPPPELSREMVTTLADLVAIGDESIRGPVADLVRLLQLQRARIAGAIGDFSGGPGRVSAQSIDLYAVNTASLYARSAALYPYARFETEAPKPVTNMDVARAISMLRYDEVADVSELLKVEVGETAWKW